MSGYKLIIGLMAVEAAIIIGVAVYVLMHLSSGISVAQGLILLGVAVGALVLVMGIILLLMRRFNRKK